MNSAISISDQINNQYRTYALYVLQSRGIPNFYDGLTPVQRLVLENSPNKFDKTVALVGEVIRTGLYHHGDSSLAGAISKLARPFGCSSQLLEGDGFFGSPVNPSPSAPRYTSVKISQIAKELVSTHYDLNEKNTEGGHDWLHVELPVGLMTQVVGIAVGYRSNILPRKMEDIVEYIEGKNKLLKPNFRDFGGKIYKFEDLEGSWIIESGVEINHKKKSIRIFDLPPVMRYDSFMKKLISKLDRSGLDFNIDNGSQSKCDVTIALRGISADEFNINSKWISNLARVIVRENVVLIKDGNVVEYDSVKEYLDHFRPHLQRVRLTRLEKDLSNYSEDLEFLEAKLKFLIYMSGNKRKNDEIIKFLSIFRKEISNRLSQIQIVKLSNDHMKETEDTIKEIKKSIANSKKLVVVQKRVLAASIKALPKKRSISLIQSTNTFTPKEIDGVEVFNPEDEMEPENVENDEEENNSDNFDY
jgi:DNA gyrase/topoisomerase IV subunit A